MRTLIKNGFVVTDTIISADVLIEGSRIIKIAPAITDYADEIIDAQNKYIMPGLIDMHCHLREPGYEYKEDIKSGTKAALQGGFTSIVCMPNTNPPIDNASIVAAVVARAAECDNAKVYPVGCITKGQKGKELSEMAFMKQEGIVGISDDGYAVADGGLMLHAMQYAATFDILTMCHSEDKSISQDGLVNEGLNATITGLKGIPRASEISCIARDIALAEEANARVHITHISCKESIELVKQAKMRGVKVSAETCPHYFAATDEEILSFNTNAKINPPLRTQDDADSIIAALIDGTIDIIATDHAPHHADEKALEFAHAPCGTSGFETALAVSYTHLVKAGHLDLTDLVKLMSSKPAQILGFDSGVLKEGAVADVIVVDLDKEFTVNPANFVSKGKNSVFSGWKLFGVVTEVFVDGKRKEIKRYD